MRFKEILEKKIWFIGKSKIIILTTFMKLKISGFLKKSFNKLISFKSVLQSSIYKIKKNFINIPETFPSFAPASPGFYNQKSKLTILSIKQTIPALNSIAEVNNKNNSFKNDFEKRITIPTSFRNKLGDLFAYHGSDKSVSHNYHHIYAEILKEPDSIKKIFEIGLGTNNRDIVSSMGRGGKPGASLRAFRDACNSALIIGADFDKRILFKEDRINCFFVDQTDLNTFTKLSKKIGDNFDLMIDDGLHAPNANLHSLKFFLNKIKIGGYAVIEDISSESREIWELTTALLPSDFSGALIKSKSSYIYVVKRIS